MAELQSATLLPRASSSSAGPKDFELKIKPETLQTSGTLYTLYPLNPEVLMRSRLSRKTLPKKLGVSARGLGLKRCREQSRALDVR